MTAGRTICDSRFPFPSTPRVVGNGNGRRPASIGRGSPSTAPLRAAQDAAPGRRSRPRSMEDEGRPPLFSASPQGVRACASRNGRSSAPSIFGCVLGCSGKRWYEPSKIVFEFGGLERAPPRNCAPRVRSPHTDADGHRPRSIEFRDRGATLFHRKTWPLSLTASGDRALWLFHSCPGDLPPNKAMHPTALRAAGDCQGVRRAEIRRPRRGCSGAPPRPRKGLTLASGSDIGAFPHARGPLTELRLLMKLGMPALHALRATTGDAAAPLGLPTLGPLAPTATADLCAFRSARSNGSASDPQRGTAVISSSRPVGSCAIAENSVD